VTEFVSGLIHTRKDQIHQLRDVVLGADDIDIIVTTFDIR
jgi:hypothetical protein